MSFGIGLGAFVDSFIKADDIRDRREQRDMDRSNLDADRAYRDKERARVDTNRDSLSAIDDEAQTEFKAAVDAGEAKASEFDSFWKTYALPKKKAELLRQGDVAGAKALEEWGNSDAALRGGRLFTSAMLKAQTGDAGGALKDVIEAGKVNGYLDHGYEFSGQEEIVKDGAVVGYRVTMKDEDGKDIVQDIAVADIPRVVATIANPDAAWASQVAAKNKQAERGAEIEDYTKKKVIDKELGGKESETYRKVHAELMKSDLNFADKTQEEQDAQVRATLDAADTYEAESSAVPAAPGLGGGAPAGAVVPTAPGKKVIVDETTGQAVPTSPVGLGAAPAAPAAPQGEAPGLGQPAAPAAAASRPTSREEIISGAAAAMANGGNPQQVAQILMQNGVSETDWPDAVRGAYQAGKAQPGR